MIFEMLGCLHAVLWWVAGTAASWQAQAAYFLGHATRFVLVHLGRSRGGATGKNMARSRRHRHVDAR